MTSPIYEAMKGLAYPVLAGPASCDHSKAKAKGYKDGWQLLVDQHDGNEMAVFCASLPTVLSAAQSRILLDGIAQEYTPCSTWQEFVAVCAEHADWKPSKGQLPPSRYAHVA